MPLLVLIFFALIAPRVVVAILWFFTRWFDGLFASILWPILGFIFLPTTLIWYSIVGNWFGGGWSTWPVVGLVIALLIDVSPMGGRRFGRRATD
ncbi:MAG: hypothetical protein HY700_16395 [Gemmatimonadetes bacterium]|nr:hypothetical protein [Gemmatimonadota bacterium]